MAKRKELSCHDCGLEAVDDCESKPFVHRSSRPERTPCVYCIRNPEKVGWYDFFHEQWTVNSEGTPIFDDTDPHGVTLLRTLRGIVQREFRKLPNIEEVR